MKLLLVGATGLVGQQVLTQAQADPRVSHITVLARKPMASVGKLQCHRVDFDQLPDDAELWQCDAVICTLGSTLKTAGSREMFYRIDHDYPLAVARQVQRYGGGCYVLNSAMGADTDSRFFYNRVKGELERDLLALSFASVTLVRPGLISGQRAEFRLGERSMQILLTMLTPVLPRRWRCNPADNIARALLDAAIRAEPGIHEVSSDTLS
ncbi:NAD(P)H-binding protein [Gynuella sunshinyii]|uniref:Putative nucleoside-diphosphate-sugar epimerase n=1 Tax=Gynuella sunshinyii YC6258 TaxID=1445510 RepID=A0A0C5W4W6_9GAMM|nr:NAD(P)H-binding protein [Gynuella sunshinyii]AJQ97649.1 putative nucleoside-diphosphate-sugar epimerase [Gynuella sunshinyii YC6258]